MRLLWTLFSAVAALEVHVWSQRGISYDAIREIEAACAPLQTTRITAVDVRVTRPFRDEYALACSASNTKGVVVSTAFYRGQGLRDTCDRCVSELKVD